MTQKPLIEITLEERREGKTWASFDGKNWQWGVRFKQFGAKEDTTMGTAERVAGNQKHLKVIYSELERLGQPEARRILDEAIHKHEAHEKEEEARALEEEREEERWAKRLADEQRNYEADLKAERARIRRWIKALGKKNSWQEVDGKRARKWMNVMSIYCQGGWDAFYMDVKLKVPWQNAKNSIPWVLKFEQDVAPELRRFPTTYYDAETFLGICQAFAEFIVDWMYLEPGLVDEFLNGCRGLKKDEPEVASALESWKQSEDPLEEAYRDLERGLRWELTRSNTPEEQKQKPQDSEKTGEQETPKRTRTGLVRRR